MEIVAQGIRCDVEDAELDIFQKVVFLAHCFHNELCGNLTFVFFATKIASMKPIPCWIGSCPEWSYRNSLSSFRFSHQLVPFLAVNFLEVPAEKETRVNFE